MESQLLDTATELFARKGYETTSLEDIAGAMGISRSALYHYVSSKASLLEMLVEQVTRSLADVLEHMASREDLSPAQKVTNVVALLVRQRAEHPDQFPFSIVPRRSCQKRSVPSTLRRSARSCVISAP
jgi:AcrR family transcriptional regulator